MGYALQEDIDLVEYLGIILLVLSSISLILYSAHKIPLVASR